MQFALQALSFSRHAQNDMLYGHVTAAPRAASGRAPLPGLRTLHAPRCAPGARSGVRILRNEGQGAGGEGGRLLISGRMADVCAALNRMAFNEYACG